MDNGIIISIVTYNSRHIFEILDNLVMELKEDSRYSVHIYDNGSEANYLEKMKTYEPFVTIHSAKDNLGFGYGHNKVFEKANSKYGFIFNPDVLATKEVLDNLVKMIQADENLAAVCPKVLNEDGTTQHLVRRKLDVFDYMLRFVPFKIVKRLFNKRLSYYECRDLSESELTYIKMGSGCMMLIDIGKFNQIGGFDERFFMYFEDNDLCLRFGEEGYKILYTPFETVVHLYEKGAHKSAKLFKVFIESMIKFFNKWGWRFF
ncbi:glycosyltransferase family 2 protein [Enterococcus rivorum]|uniref:Glycosyl transferase family 2 n=1 Tax=Enterococcus rivorum TaxID=762845 RepID=A0A1E5KVH7_9ENTE|nr:glycosyltransferase family 2 protein [Enterococcus rivorum]MBP2098398.1 GT2 family glycosyltransferase [Enterococcus rivorum]OEH81818.1 glycosyl transferase family 2 [Enterococcus rivorum]